jgi:hypothetical protein
MHLIVPKDSFKLRSWELEVAKGLTINDILHMPPQEVAITFWKQDGSHFEYSWFWELQPHMNEHALCTNPWFAQLTPELKLWMKFPAVSRKLVKQRPPPLAVPQRESPLQFVIEL